MKAVLVPVLALSIAAGSASAARTPVLVTYVESGGFAGVTSRAVVRADGVVERDGPDARISKARVRALKQALARARFRTLQRQYGEPCCDKIARIVVYRGRTVTVYDPAHPPLRLRRVLSLLAGLA